MSKKKIKCIQKRIESARRNGNVRLEAEFQNDLGAEFRAQDDFEDAIEAYLTGVQLAESCSGHADAYYAHRAIAEMSAESGERQSCLHHLELLRKSAERSGQYGLIQLSFHVSAWCYEKLWDKCPMDDDLDQAEEWAQHSVDYLKRSSEYIDRDKQGVLSGGTSATRKCKVLRLLAEIQAAADKRSDADRNWNSAMVLATNLNNADLKYELLLSRSTGFPWANSLEAARRLVNVANKNKKHLASLELSQAEIAAGRLDDAWNTLLGVCLMRFEGQDHEDLLDRIVLVYGYRERKRLSEIPGTSRLVRRKMYEKIADSLCEFEIPRRKALKELALTYYKKMLKESEGDKQRKPALISLAETAVDVGSYEAALEYYRDSLEIEQKRKSDVPAICTKASMLNVRCRAGSGSIEAFEAELDQLLKVIPEQKKRHLLLKSQLYEKHAEYLAEKKNFSTSQIFLSKAHSLTNKLNDLGNETDSEDEEEDDGTGNIEDPMDGRIREGILNECQELARQIQDENKLLQDKEKTNEKGETKLHEAARIDDPEHLQKLIELGYNVNRRDFAGWTPLSEAVSAGLLQNVQLLLKAKACVDPVGDSLIVGDDETSGEMTPLMEACCHGFSEIARVLLKHGASVGKHSRDRWTAVDYAREALVTEEIDDRPGFEALVRDMETLQTKSGIQVRRGPPPKRKIWGANNSRSSAASEHPKTRKSTSPSHENLNSYKNVLDRLGGKSRRKEREFLTQIDDNAVMLDDDDDVIVDSRSQAFCSSENSRRSFGSTRNDCNADFVENDIRSRKKRKPDDTESVRKRRRFNCEPTMFNSEGNTSFTDMSTNILDEPDDIDTNMSPGSRSMNSEPFRSQRNSLPKERRNTFHSPTKPFGGSPHGISPTQCANLMVTLKFVDHEGNSMKAARMVQFSRSSLVSDVTSRCADILNTPVAIIQIMQGETELEGDISLLSLFTSPAELRLELICCAGRSTAEQKYLCSTSDPSSEMVAVLKDFDSNSNIRLRSQIALWDISQAVGRPTKLNEVELDYAEVSEEVDSVAQWLSVCCSFKAHAASFDDKLFSTQMLSYDCLKRLDISFAHLQDGAILARALDKMPSLEELVLDGVIVETETQAVASTIAHLNSLEKLSLVGTEWLTTECQYIILSGCEQLKDIDFSTNRLLADLTVGSLPSILKANFAGCEIENYESLIEWVALCATQEADLSDTEFNLDHLKTVVNYCLSGRGSILRLRIRGCHELDTHVVEICDVLSPHILSQFPLKLDVDIHLRDKMRSFCGGILDVLC